MQIPPAVTRTCGEKRRTKRPYCTPSPMINQVQKEGRTHLIRAHVRVAQSRIPDRQNETDCGYKEWSKVVV